MTDNSRTPIDRLLDAIPALTFTAALVLMVNQSYVKVLEAIGRARFLPALLMCAIGALWIVQHRRLPRRFRWFDGCAVAFLAFAFASTTWALDFTLSLNRTLSLAAFYVAVFWVMWIDVDRHGPERIAGALVGAVAVAMAINLASAFVVPEGAFYAPPLRYQGIMNNPNALGALVALMLPLALWARFRYRTRWTWILVAVMLVTAQLTQSRTTAIAGVIGAGYYLFHVWPERRLRLASIGVFYLTLTAVVPQLTYAYHEYTSRTASRAELEQKYAQAQKELTLAEQKAAYDKMIAATKPPPPPAPVVPYVPSEPAPKAPPVPVEPAPIPKTPQKPDLPIEVEEALKRYEELNEAVGRARAPMAPDLVDPLKNPRNAHLSTFSGRTLAWQLALNYLSERPFTGFGFGNEELVMPAHGIVEGMYTFTGHYFHSSYVGLATQVGPIAALVFFLPLAALAIGEWRVPASKENGALRYALRAVLLTGLVVASFESWVYAMGNAHAFPFWTCVMLLTWMNTRTDAAVMSSES